MLCRKIAANRLFGVWRPTPFFLPKSVSIGFCFLPRLRFLFTIFLLTFCIIAHCARFVKGFLKLFLFFSERTAEDLPPTENCVSTFGFLSPLDNIQYTILSFWCQYLFYVRRFSSNLVESGGFEPQLFRSFATTYAITSRFTASTTLMWHHSPKSGGL